MLYLIARYLLFPVAWLYLRTRVFGWKNTRVKGSAIVVCNHLNTLDPVVLAYLFRRPIRFLAKSELYTTPFWIWFYGSILTIPVQRKTADLSSLKMSLKLLGKGKILGIFPEGTRSSTGELGAFEKGVGLMAQKSQAEIIPIYIHPGSYKPLRPKVIIGEHINIKALIADVPRSEQLERINQTIENAVKDLGKQLEKRLCKSN